MIPIRTQLLTGRLTSALPSHWSGVTPGEEVNNPDSGSGQPQVAARAGEKSLKPIISSAGKLRGNSEATQGLLRGYSSVTQGLLRGYKLTGNSAWGNEWEEKY